MDTNHTYVFAEVCELRSTIIHCMFLIFLCILWRNKHKRWKFDSFISFWLAIYKQRKSLKCPFKRLQQHKEINNFYEWGWIYFKYLAQFLHRGFITRHRKSGVKPRSCLFTLESSSTVPPWPWQFPSASMGSLEAVRSTPALGTSSLCTLSCSENCSTQ